jgi:hypothetical protein
MPTDFDLLDSIYPLPHEELYRQWVLGRDASVMPDTWPRWTLRGWTLAAHDDAHVCRLATTSGAPIGWVIQPQLHTDAGGARRPRDEIRIAADPEGPDETAIEHGIYGRDAAGRADGTGLEGMWIAIVIAEGLSRVYLGPTHSVVYDRDKQRVATSHNLLAPFERDLELSRAFDPIATNLYYSFGLTPFRGVRRLLPNHYLDLDDFAAVRHWPKAPFPRRSAQEGVSAMVAHGRRLLHGLSEGVERIEVPLSAGNDSRAVLSLLQPIIAEGRVAVRPFTTVGLAFEQRIDLQGGRRLARIAGLPHETRPRQRHQAAPVEILMRNFARIGEAKSGSALSRPQLLAPPTASTATPERKLTVAGMGGETGRAFYWSGGAPAQLTASDLVRRVGAPILEATRTAAQDWIDGLPDFVRDEPADALDLAYVEQRMGCWEANARYLFPGRPDVISPMASGRCIDAVFGLPEGYRRTGRLQQDMVAQAWPALLAVPFNRATGALLVEQKLRGLARRLRPIDEATARI